MKDFTAATAAYLAELDTERAAAEGGHRIARLPGGRLIHAWACPCHLIAIRAES